MAEKNRSDEGRMFRLMALKIGGFMVILVAATLAAVLIYLK